MSKKIGIALHSMALVLSLLLVLSLSVDAFDGVAFYTDRHYLRFQFWICILFLSLFFLELYFSERRKTYFFRNLVLLLLILPYLNIFNWLSVPLTDEATLVFRFIPLVRGYVAISFVTFWLMKDKVAGLFVTYLAVLFSFVYFSSLMFYVLEMNVNPMVHTFGDSLWFAFMTVTTVGSNIYAVTVVGKILSVLLAGVGMMMLPIFTVYLTGMIKRARKI